MHYCLLLLILDDDESALNEMRSHMMSRLHMQIGDSTSVSKATGLTNATETILVDRELVEMKQERDNFVVRGLDAYGAEGMTTQTVLDAMKVYCFVL